MMAYLEVDDDDDDDDSFIWACRFVWVWNLVSHNKVMILDWGCLRKGVR
jgi:3-mercaptopyruvate sulfurtransferase SseA